MNLKIELSAHVYAAHRGLENESLVDVIDTQIPVTSNQCDSRLQLIPDTSECLSGEIRVDAKAAHVEPAGKKTRGERLATPLAPTIGSTQFLLPSTSTSGKMRG